MKLICIIGLFLIVPAFIVPSNACGIFCPEKKSCNGDSNAHHEECGDPCPTTCDNKDDGGIRPCPRICIRNGCKCNDGYVLGPDKKCILPCDCPPKPVKGCKGDLNAHHAPCGDPCPTTCHNLNDGGIRPCPKICIVNGCKCNEGYVLGPKGRCIKPRKCPPKPACCKGDPNAHHAPCGDPCPTTCDNKDDGGIRPCPRICIRNGCKCNKGFVLGPKGRCIRPWDCPAKPPVCCKGDPNAHHAPCGDPCPTTCDNLNDGGNRPCPAICLKNGCKCNPGYVLGPEGLCIKPCDCPRPKCNTNEIYVRCVYSHPVDITCQQFFEGAKPKIDENSKKGCRCKLGYVRNCNGKCVLPEDCCEDPNSELVACPNGCPGGTCDHPEFVGCYIGCKPYGCQCKKGYVKLSETNPECVRLDSCIHKCHCK